MASGDSLYDVSVSPPPRQRSPTENRDRNTMANFVSRRPGTQSSRAAATATGNLRHPTQSSSTPRAPVANMTSTPLHRQQSSLETPTSGPRSTGKNKGKDADYFQADADAKEDARDRADGDWQGTQDSGISEPPRKRRKQSSAQERARIVDEPREERTDPNSYSNVKLKKRQERDSYISRMRSNWGEPTTWMPESDWPIIFGKTDGELVDRDLLKDLQDCSAPLLEQLAKLSDITRHRPERAFEALQAAVDAMNRGGGGPRIRTKDVERVIEQIERSKARSIAPRTPPYEPPHEATDDGTGQPVDQVTPDQDQIIPAPQLPSPWTPNTSTHVRVKQEFQPLAEIVHSKSAEPERGRSSDIPPEVNIGTEKGWETGRAKRRLRNELAQLENEEKQLQNEQRQLENKHKQLQIKEQMLALGDQTWNG